MKCLISIGLILPALAAVIGVAAWAVSADVVMNSGNNRVNKVDNSLLQSFSMDNDNRPDIFRTNEESHRRQPQPQAATTSTTRSTTSTEPSTTSTTTTTTTTTTIAPPPQTLSPKDASDVNAILSKLISASGAASGSSGPRFVVVAPLPDSPEGLDSALSISRSDHSTAENPSNERQKDDSWHASKSEQNSDMIASGSSQSYSISKPNIPPSNKVPYPHQRIANSTNRFVHPSGESTRRIGEKSHIIHITNGNHRPNNGHHSQPIELTGFEPFDSMMQAESLSAANSHVQMNPPPNYPSSFKRGPPQGYYNHRNPHNSPPHFELKDQPMYNGPHLHDHNMHGFQMKPRPHMMAPHQPVGIGLKPIQKQLHHIDNGPQPEESRWGAVGFVPPPSSYVHKPPEGISLSISQPANSGTHVSAEPVSVIKSFFLPFLPKPRLNMNARVVFGVVLDKGMGIGGKKDAGHRPY